MTRRYPIEEILGHNQFTYKAYTLISGQTEGQSQVVCEINTEINDPDLLFKFKSQDVGFSEEGSMGLGFQIQNNPDPNRLTFTFYFTDSYGMVSITAGGTSFGWADYSGIVSSSNEYRVTWSKNSDGRLRVYIDNDLILVSSSSFSNLDQFPINSSVFSQLLTGEVVDFELGNLLTGGVPETIYAVGSISGYEGVSYHTSAASVYSNHSIQRSTGADIAFSNMVGVTSPPSSNYAFMFGHLPLEFISGARTNINRTYTDSYRNIGANFQRITRAGTSFVGITTYTGNFISASNTSQGTSGYPEELALLGSVTVTII